MKFEIWPTKKAAALRKAFIQQFIDMTSDHYQKHIATLVQDTDGLCYDGYLWNCLQDNNPLPPCRCWDPDETLL